MSTRQMHRRLVVARVDGAPGLSNPILQPGAVFTGGRCRPAPFSCPHVREVAVSRPVGGSVRDLVCSHGGRGGGGSGPDCSGDNLARFGGREERDRYMDSLERQMEQQREEIQRTLDRTLEGEGSERRTALEKVWGSLPGFSGRTRVQDSEKPTPAPGGAPQVTGSPQTDGARRPWWRRAFGG